ncbi:MAG TPA: arsinothricin resistance N-acetyltransferase ArsN1 family B [Novosphingobium sp.]|nr:arsinothricin resistance N-acetyltransferase ArsN1 family B [Novosphingobium sp.]
MLVREATLEDALAIQTIYAPYVDKTSISFEEVAPNALEIEGRIATILSKHPYFVAEEGGRVVGYAYASEHRSRAAYRCSVDVAVYVAEGGQRRGVGRALYSALLSAAAAGGYHAAFAGIALPNDRSVGLHEAMGFVPVGVFREVGYKFGRWHDVGWWQRLL